MSFENPKELIYTPSKEIVEIQRRVDAVESMVAVIESFKKDKTDISTDNRGKVSTIMNQYTASQSQLYSVLDSSKDSLEHLAQIKLTDPNIAPTNPDDPTPVVQDTKFITDKPLSDIYVDTDANVVLAGTKARGLAIGTVTGIDSDFTLKNHEYGISSLLSVLVKLNATTILIGSNNGLIFYNLTDGSFVIKKNTDGLPSNTVTALYVTEEGYIIVGTDNGLAISKSGGSSFGSYDIYQSLRGITVNCIEVYTDSSGVKHLLVGTPSGVYTKDMTIDTNSITSVTDINTKFTSRYVNDIKYDNNKDVLYIATDTGLLVVKYFTSAAPSYTLKNGYDGLSSSTCYSLLFDSTGLYIGTNAGISYTKDAGASFTIYSKNKGIKGYTCNKIKIAKVDANGIITHITILHAIGLTYNFAIPTT